MSADRLAAERGGRPLRLMGMRTRLSVLVALIVAVLVGGLLTACGAADEGSGDSAAPPEDSVSSSASPGADGSLPPGFTASPPVPSPSKFESGEVTLTGKPQEGVEPGCLVMQSGGQSYLLLGGDRKLLTSGRAVIVRGKPNPGLMTTCQQGTPFEVSEVLLA
jgi:hypothetical protein